MDQEDQILQTQWMIPSGSFTTLEVSEISDIIWNTEETSVYPRMGSAHFELVTVLREDIRHWMISNGIRYHIDILSSSLVFFDRDSFLLFKLTWSGS